MNEEQMETEGYVSHSSGGTTHYMQTPFAGGGSSPLHQTTQSMSRVNLNNDNVSVNISSNLTKPITPLASLDSSKVHTLLREHAMAKANNTKTPPITTFMEPTVLDIISISFDARESEFPSCTNDQWKEISDEALSSALIRLVGTPESLETKLNALGHIRQKHDNAPVSVQAITGYATKVYLNFNKAREFNSLNADEVKAVLRVLLEKIKTYNKKMHDELKQKVDDKSIKSIKDLFKEAIKLASDVEKAEATVAQYLHHLKDNRKENANEQKGGSPNNTKCDGCGRPHHTREQCRLKNHPDFNKEGPYPNQTPVAFNKRLDGTPWSNPQQQQQQGQKRPHNTYGPGNNNKSKLTILGAISDPSTDLVPITVVAPNDVTLRTKALIDNGATGSSFVSQTVASWLEENGAEIGESNHHVKTAIKDKAVRIVGMVTLSCSVNNEITNDKIPMIFPSLVIDSEIDVIVGRPAIKQYRLVRALPSQFEDVEEAVLPGASIMPDNTVSQQWLSAMKVTPYQTGRLDVEADDEDDLDDIESYHLPDTPPSGTEHNNSSPGMVSPLPETFGSEEFRARVDALNFEFRDIFRDSVAEQPADLPSMKVELIDELNGNNQHTWGNRSPPPRQQSSKNQDFMKTTIDKMLKLRVIRRVTQNDDVKHYSQVHVANKNDKQRFCLDFRDLNSRTRSNHFPLPNVPEMFERVKHKAIYGKLDATNGYWNIMLDPLSQVLCAFVTIFGVFCCLRVPFGLKNAVAYFQQLMTTVVLVGLVMAICEVYIDDVLLYADTEDDFIVRLREIYLRFRKYRIYLNPAKCKLGMTETEFLGRVLSRDTIKASESKKAAIAAFVKPSTQKNLKKFLGLTNWLSTFIPDYARRAAVLHQSLRNYKAGSKLTWTPAMDAAYEDMKDAVADCQALWFIDEQGKIYLYTDASIIGIGACLMQEINGIQRPILFYSQKFSDRQARWSTPDQECYAIFIAIKKFAYLLHGRHFYIMTDHANLRYLNSPVSRKVYAWKLEIQAHDAEWVHVPGKENPSDEFSRLCVLLNRGVVEEAEAANDDEFRYPVRALAPPVDISHDKLVILQKYHNSLVGHVGQGLLIERIRRHESADVLRAWTTCRSDAKTFIRLCANCQKMSQIALPIQAHRFVTHTLYPFQVVAVDTIGPFPPDKYGNVYIVAFICAFSRYLQLYPSPDASAETAARPFTVSFGRFGAPERVRSDNGKQFVNTMISEFFQIVGTGRELSIAYSHEENGIIERANKETLKNLRNILFDKNVISEWSDVAPLVERIHNARAHSTTGVSPASLIFGNSVDLDRGLFLPHEQGVPSITYSAWQARMLDRQARIIAVAQKHLEADASRHALKQPAHPTLYPNGSYVLQSYPDGELPSKFHTPHAGPYRVLNSRGNTYSVQNLVTMKAHNVQVKFLRPFHYNPDTTDPLTVALKDDKYFVMERVMGHRGDPKKRKLLEFQVKWLGLEYDKDQWQPWSYVRRGGAVLDDYLKTVPQLKYLIGQHK